VEKRNTAFRVTEVSIMTLVSYQDGLKFLQM